MVLKAYKYRLYPTKEQAELIERHFGCCRFVWNYFLSLRKETWDKEKKHLSFYEIKKLLPELKKQNPWLKEVNSQSLQEVVIELERSYQRFFKGICNFPLFKKKKKSQSFSIPQHFRIESDRVYLPKFKTGIKFKKHREFTGLPKRLYITRTPSGKYFLLVVCETEINVLPENKYIAGVDLGIKNFVTIARVNKDNTLIKTEKVPHPKTLQKYEKRIKRLQRQLSRKQKGSKNRQKARIKLAKIWEKAKNVKYDYLHKLSSRLINENQVICLEDLNIKGMIKNRKLSKNIWDSAWYEFIRQLRYKAMWYGRKIATIPLFYPSSKTCSNCGWIFSDMDLSVREWECPCCGAKHDRDINASINVVKVGMEQPEFMPVEETTRVFSMRRQVVPVKQEAMHGISIP
ncbi:RNA-guided endonuclease TnpB family protein [Calditerrivibrio nitroreducens]|uniref:Transposase, IS605 OrfB family n=1 Tax=Calditerrivibrio nitroreducens (strain DSM 19672 / NBRC 101217 / Yu37-1) TaxID=768670 RepID=E4TK97_CALNY|nr:RNA-guided endonuclease TnpB family protein [Calditerrivibrio nitroreducens]ADR19969.1 transposase, IS605 OrfB family [Calditerrivibrio nitroreducens DSM 19672]